MPNSEMYKCKSIPSDLMVLPFPSLSRYLVYYWSLVQNERTCCDKILSLFWCCMGKDDDYFRFDTELCLQIARLAVKLPSNPENIVLVDTIQRLDDLASKYLLCQRKEIRIEMNQVFVSSFLPKLQKLFVVPKLHILSHDMEISLNSTEILAGFIDFVLQIVDYNMKYSNRQDAIHGKLLTLLTFLGDTPFRCIDELEEINNDDLLAETEMLANEVGNYVYSVFASKIARKFPLDDSDRRCALLEKFELLDEKIKEHYIKFSVLPPRSGIPRATVLDPLYVVDSLLEDLYSSFSVTDRKYFISNDYVLNQLRTLYEELKLSRPFIKDTMSYSTALEGLEESLARIREVAYEAEYIIHARFVGDVPDWCLILRLPGIIENIKIIRQILQEMKEKLCNIKVKHLPKLYSGQASTRAKGTLRNKIDDVIVVSDEIRTKIRDDLVRGTRNRQVISIYGMPGLGKTTIANVLYIDRSVKEHFDRSGWAVASQNYHKRKVMIDILISLSGSQVENVDKDKIRDMKEEELGVAIHKYLTKRRYIIVIDDVWDIIPWNDLSIFFPDNGNGSRVILTSRIQGASPADSICHPLPLLSKDQCCHLLVKKVFSRDPCPQELVGVANKISAKCHGLPLAVVVIAGILKNLANKVSTWEKIERNLGLYLSDDSRGYMKILELSYEHLPSHLKPCFLYLGAFPEDIEIPVQKLKWLWVAEGFIRGDEKNPDHVAENYLIDLINRSLVLIAKCGFDGGIKSCSIHDLLRDMCLRRAHQGNFMKYKEMSSSHYGAYLQSPNMRRSSVLCRALLGDYIKWSCWLPQVPFVRVIDVLERGRVADGVLSEIKRHGPLDRLRYLGGVGTPFLRKYADYVFNISHDLECICVRYWPMDNKLICCRTLQKLVKLRHLRVEEPWDLDGHWDVSVKTNLNSLTGITLRSEEDVLILLCSPHLKRLKCLNLVMADFDGLLQLESLTINYIFRDLFWRFHPEPQRNLAKNKFPRNIKKLSLYDAILSSEVLSSLGKLPYLEVLKLNAHIVLGEWEMGDDEFQKLRFLKLKIDDLKQWSVGNDSFPELQVLLLKNCRALYDIPSELDYVTTLETIEVHGCSLELGKSAEKLAKEQLDYGNEIRIIIKSPYNRS